MESEEIQQLARAVAMDLLQHDPPPVTGDLQKVTDVIARAIQQNFATEDAIIQEAVAALNAMGAQTAGMDRGTLLAGLRDRIAKQKGFAL